MSTASEIIESVFHSPACMCPSCAPTSILDALDAAGYVVVPKEATPAMLAAAAPDVGAPDIADYHVALAAVGLLPPTHHPDVADVLAGMVKDYRAMIAAALAPKDKP